MRASTPMSARPRRSAWGFAITDRNDWRIDAACRNVDPDLFFNRSTRSLALHVCHRHCPVIAECLAFARANPPYECVMGGMAWRGGWNNARPIALHNGVKPAHTCELCTVDKADASSCPDWGAR